MSKKIKSFDQLDTAIAEMNEPATTSEPTPEPTPDPTPTPEPEPKETAPEPTPEPKTAAPEGTTAPDTTPKTYEPNLKFKVHDQEYDMDPIFKPIITNKDIEEKVRVLHAKAQGVEVIQKARDNWKTKAEEVEKVNSQYEQIFQKPIQLYNEGKTTEALRALAKDEDIINAAIEIYNYQNMDPAQKAVIDKQKTLEMQNEEMTLREQQWLQSQATEMAGRVHSEMDFAISRPDIAEIVTKVDEVYGAGYFKTKALNIGEAEWNKGNRLSPIQCVQKTLDEYAPLVKRFIQNTSSTPNPTTSTAPQAPKPTIPSIKSAGSAPKKGKPATYADIDKKIEELSSSD